MNMEEIIHAWLDIDTNREKLPTIQYPKEIYDFVEMTATKFHFGSIENEPIYYFNGTYQKIKCGDVLTSEEPMWNNSYKH
jgi:hypothetical protein